MPGRGSAGRRQAFFSYTPTFKVVRKLLGVASSSNSAITDSWPFAVLQKCIPIPATLSRTWYISDDDTAEWHLDYSAPPPKRMTRDRENEISSKTQHVAKTVNKHFHDEPALLRPKSEAPFAASTTSTLDTVDDQNLSQDLSFEALQKQARVDAQFGPIGSHDHRYVSKHMGGELANHIMDVPPYFYIVTTYLSYNILIAFGRVRDFFGIRFKRRTYKHITSANGYAALNSDWSNFYFRRLKMRMNDCFSRP